MDFQATFRLLRRGIPFGPAYNYQDLNDPINKKERGLFFISYQTSIVNQFELLTSKWMNEDSRPETRMGYDMVVGQNNEEDESGVKWCKLQSGAGPQRMETAMPFVTPTGGGYFFCPSLSAVQTIIDRCTK